jgi:AbiU2
LIWLAVAFYETYVPSGQDAGLIDRVNKSDFYPAFNVISDALHRNVIVTLCRIWDTRTDTANLNSLADEFRDPKVLADLMAIGHQVDPQHLGKWLTEIDMVSKSDELLALRRARH